MSKFSFRRIAATFAAIFTIAMAQPVLGQTVAVSPRTRIIDKVDASRLTLLTRSHSANVSSFTDLGRAPASTPMQNLMLVLQSSPEQEQALHTLMDAQQDKNTPSFHKWLTPDTFGQSFGVAQTDIASINAWLQDSGFSINSVAHSSRLIMFSGTAGLVEKAFHTEMHQYMVNGEVRISNSTDISLPTALTPVVLGVARLDNFKMKSQMTPMSHVARTPTGDFHPVHADGTPDTTFGSGTHYLGGGDFAVVYDEKPLLAAGTNGAGQKIGILGQTDILLGDIQTYRSIFGLPNGKINFITVGNDPGTISDDIESDLDVEVSGAFAPGAQIDFYLSGNDYFGGGIDASGVYVVENNSDDIISLSYGEAEQDLGTYNAFFNSLWEQASSQGISVFVSSGDSGPDVHQDGATSGNVYSVSGISGTPFNVSVGGTMFNEGTATGATPYWGPTGTSPYVTALSYIPEIVWNEGSLDPYGNVGYGGIVAASSGISIEYGTPPWQTGPGVPTTDPTPTKGTVTGFLVPGPHRYQPDVSLAAAGAHDGTLICSEGSCEVDSNGNLLNAGVVGGTSIAAPSFAGTQAVINQANGGRQGLPNYYYYRLAALQSLTNCNAATLPSAAGATCAFHDAQTGNNFIPSARGGTIANGSYIGWTANPGYDLTVGLGSPDITNVANQWKSVTFSATTTAFTLTPTTGPSGQTENFTVTVAPASGAGTPTGNVSIIAQALYGGIGFVTLSGGHASGTLASANLQALPAGTYAIHAHYAGDVTYGGSDSAAITVIITSSSTSIINTSYLLATNGGLTATSTFAYGQNVYIDTSVCTPAGIAVNGCAGGAGTPTGTITYTLTKGAAVLPVLVSPLDSFDDAYFDAGIGYSGYDIKPNYPSVAAPQVLAPGVYSVATKYSGDSTFSASTGTPLTITITQATQALALSTSTATIAPGGTAILNASIVTLDPTSGGVPATGTVTFTDTTTSTVLGTATLTNGAVVFTTTGIVTPGAHSVSATYSGDTNYAPVTSAIVTITVGGTPTVTTLTETIAGVAATSSTVGQSVVLVAAVASPATGTVYFYDGSVLLGTATLSTTTHTASRTVANFTAGTHSLTATYAGNTTLQSSSSTATAFIVAKNAPSLQLTNQTQNASLTGVAMNVTFTPAPDNAANISPFPTGNVNFLDGTTVLGSAGLSYYSNFGTIVSAYTTAALKPGVHVLSASYPGDANYGTATSNTQTINIGLTTTLLTLSSNNLPGGASLVITAVVTPLVANTTGVGGSMAFYDGTTLIGTSMVTGGVATLMISTPVLAPGITHSISAVFSGDPINYYTSTSNTATVVFGLNTLTVTPPPAPIGAGEPVPISATIAPISAVIPTGTVKFYDGATLLGTASGTFTGGKATITATFAGVGPHTIMAVYSGDGNYAASSTTSTISITTVTPGFTITANPTALTLTRGQSGAIAITATVVGDYNGYGYTTVSGLPAGATYTVLQSPYVFSGVNGSQTYNIFIVTVAPQARAVTIGSVFWIPALLLAGIVGWRRKKMSLIARQLMVFSILMLGLLTASGCGNSNSNPGTTPGSVTATVTMTGVGSNAASPAVTATATVAVTIQ